MMIRTAAALRTSLILLALGTATAGGCRKAEPEEIVNFAGNSGGSTQEPPPSSGTGGAGAPGAGGASFPSDRDAGDGGGAGGAPEPGDLCDVPAPVLDGPFSKSKLLEAAASCARGHYCRFLATAEVLRDTTAAFSADRSDENRTAAQEAFRVAMSSWQAAELFRFGPAAGRASPGGANLRSEIYVFPGFARCSTEQQLVRRTYATSAFTGEGSTLGARTLAAIEYLLFYPGTDNACLPFSDINTSGSWNALGEAELSKRKADYAAAAADDVFRKAEALVNAWDPEHGNFLQKLLAAGSGSSPFDTDHDALNAVNEALFYVEVEVKDKKLGIPIGIHEDCPTASCPQDFESLYALDGAEHLRTNIAGARRLFEGCGEDFAGIGFDDWLRAVGAGDLADEMIAALAGAEQAAAALGSPPSSDLPGARALHDALRPYALLLKNDFVSILNLDEPAGSVGDND